MGRIVCAYATSHVLFDPAPDPERAARIVRGMTELGRRASAAHPDVLIVVASEHLFNFDLRLQAPFCVGVAERYEPWGDLGIPPRPFPGHAGFAAGLVAHAAAEGFDLAVCDGIRPDHGVTLPLMFVRPWGSVPVVPLYVNVNMAPPPTPARCCALGEAIRRYVTEVRPRQERTAIVASGGLSHWLNVPGAGNVAEDFDRWCIDVLTGGRWDELARLSAAEIERQAGNGGLELLNWLLMAAAVPEARGEPVYYEPMPAWYTGMGGVAMHV